MTGKRYLCARCGMGLNNAQITHHGGLCCSCSEAVEREVHHEPAEATAAAEQRLRERIEALTLDPRFNDHYHRGWGKHRAAVLALLGSDAPAPRETPEQPERTIVEKLRGLGADPDAIAFAERHARKAKPAPSPASPRQGEPVARLTMRGWALSFDAVERWLVLTDPDGASAIVARDVALEYGGDIAGHWQLAAALSEPAEAGEPAP